MPRNCKDWSNETIARLIELYRTFRPANGHAAAIEKAQRELGLPEEMQYSVNTLKAIKNLPLAWRQPIADIDQEVRAAKVADPREVYRQAKQERKAALKETLDALAAKYSKPAPVPVQIQQAPVELTAAELFVRLTDRLKRDMREELFPQIRALIQEQLADHLDYLTGPATNAGEVTALPVPEKLPRVLVVGLIEKQEAIVRSAVGGVKLTFCRASSTSHLAEMCKHVDCAIVMAGFVGHSTDALVQKHAQRVIRHSGGIGGLITKIREIRDEATDAGRQSAG